MPAAGLEQIPREVSGACWLLGSWLSVLTNLQCRCVYVGLERPPAALAHVWSPEKAAALF